MQTLYFRHAGSIVTVLKHARACDVTKIITIGRIKYESLENGTEKISQVNLCAEPSIN